jgi:predicted nucleic-acid-binding Zn-ribbon protein
MTVDKRTGIDSIYLNILRKHGPLSVKEVAKEAHEHPTLRDKKLATIEKDVARFTERHETLEFLSRKDGKIHLLQTPTDPQNKGSQTQPRSFVINSEGFLTPRMAVTCIHCGLTIDLTKVPIKWRVNSHALMTVLHVHHFIRVTCPKCGWTGRYDTQRDVKPFLP